MKTKLILIALLAVGVTAISAAQSSGVAGSQPVQSTAAPKPKHALVAALESVTGLTANQKTQIKGMLKQRAADNKAFRQANKGNKAALKAHSKQETQAFMTSLKTVLTPSQFHQFEANLKALKGKGSKAAKSGTGAGTAPVKP